MIQIDTTEFNGQTLFKTPLELVKVFATYLDDVSFIESTLADELKRQFSIEPENVNAFISNDDEWEGDREYITFLKEQADTFGWDTPLYLYDIGGGNKAALPEEHILYDIIASIAHFKGISVELMDD